MLFIFKKNENVINLKFLRIIVLIISIVFIFSLEQCTLTKNKSENPKEKFLSLAPKGKISNSIQCKNFIGQSYCVYLPLGYNIEKKYPAIYFFDPHGKGSFPIEKYKEIAEKFDIVFIGSNNSKNGIQQNEIDYILEAIFTDTKEKISIDSTQIYVAGFSGGSRIASYAALKYKNIKGVIACSASFSTNNYAELKFDFAGIAGLEDMNYLEVKNFIRYLNNYSLRHSFFEFNGKHEWPPLETFTKASFWIIQKTENNSLNEEIEKEEIFEQTKREEYINKFPNQDINYWRTEIAKLEKDTNSENLKLSLANKRLVAFIGLISYSYVNSAINQKNIPASDYFLQIYEMVGKENPDYYYFNACNLAMKSKNDEAIKSLENAIEFGFSDFEKMKNDPVLSSLKSDASFLKIININSK